MAMDEQKRKERAAVIRARKKLSRDWLRDGFYPQCELVYKNYKAEPDIKVDENGEEDPDLTNLGSPMTFTSTRKTVARVTAQIPNFRFHSSEKLDIQTDPQDVQLPLGELIGRTLMFQWDRARMQRSQKRHVLQAALFGWSPRIWHYAVEEYPRRKRVSIEQIATSPDLMGQVATTYEINPEVMVRLAMEDPGALEAMLTQLIEQHGKGGLLPIEYRYRYYEGPKAGFTFMGDCYPEPHFNSLRDSKWFIVNKRVNLDWLKRLGRDYEEECASGVAEVLREQPNGTGRRFDTLADTDDEELFRNMLSVINRTTEQDTAEAYQQSGREKEWLLTCHHVPGPDAHIEYTCEDIYIGRIDYPFDLAGRIAVTDCVLIDDLLSGFGDSIPRIMRGLHQVHSKELGYRQDVAFNLLRPMIGTSSRELLNNPDAIKRKHGFRMMYLRDPQQVWQQSEMQALASLQASLQNDQSLIHQWFMFTGENAMTSTAMTDPSASRTATGVRYSAQQLDVLTKDLQDMFLQSSLIEDAEMMWMLNRSEITDGVWFEVGKYNRSRMYAETEDHWKEAWARAEPLHFQVDGEVTVEAGSTLADDSAERQQQAEFLFQQALARPDVISIERARDEVLISMGRRNEIPDWVPPPPPPPPEEIKRSQSLTISWKDLSPAEKISMAQRFDLNPEEGPPGGQMEIPPPEQGVPVNGFPA